MLWTEGDPFRDNRSNLYRATVLKIRRSGCAESVSFAASAGRLGDHSGVPWAVLTMRSGVCVPSILRPQSRSAP
jgi:hypothetical protein